MIIWKLLICLPFPLSRKQTTAVMWTHAFSVSLTVARRKMQTEIFSLKNRSRLLPLAIGILFSMSYEPHKLTTSQPVLRWVKINISKFLPFQNFPCWDSSIFRSTHWGRWLISLFQSLWIFLRRVLWSPSKHQRMQVEYCSSLFIFPDKIIWLPVARIDLPGFTRLSFCSCFSNMLHSSFSSNLMQHWSCRMGLCRDKLPCDLGRLSSSCSGF